MKNIIPITFLMLSPASIAGDYMLYIANEDNSSGCEKAKYWTVNTAKEVSLSFTQYFSGKHPNIGILSSAFANGHFRFCGSTEVNEILSTLYGIQESGAPANKTHLIDFISKIEAIR